MKKGLSVVTLILALVFLVIVITILFIQPGLLRKAAEKGLETAEKGLEKAVNVSKQERSELRLEEGSYFGRQLFLPSDDGEWTDDTTYVIYGAVIDCYNTCLKTKEVTFCNYISAEEISVGKTFLELKEDLKQYLGDGLPNKDDLFFVTPRNAMTGKPTFDRIEKDGAYSIPLIEICCDNDQDVYIAPFGECLSTAKEDWSPAHTPRGDVYNG